MSKLLSIPALFLLAVLFAGQANAQQCGVLLLSPYGVDVNPSSVSFQVGQDGSTSTETLNASLQGGTGSIIMGSLTYHEDPSTSHPLTLGVPSGNSVSITNSTGGAITAWVQISIQNPNGGTIDVSGTQVHVSGYYATLPLPAVSAQTYTSVAGLGPVNPYGNYPGGTVPIQIDIEYAPAH